MKTIALLLTVSTFTSCISNKHWSNSIKNSDNSEYVIECGFNLDKPVNKITQKEFNLRYLVIN